VLRRTVPVMTRVSWLAYCALGCAVAIACAVLIRLGSPLLPSHAYTLFALLLCGVLLNAHANLSGELLQASGRFERLIAVAGVSLALLVGIFFATKSALAVQAIGVAWLGSQWIGAMLMDAQATRILELRGVTLRLLGQRALPSVAVLLALLGCVGVAAPLPILVVTSVAILGASALGLVIEERSLLAEWWRSAAERLGVGKGSTPGEAMAQELRESRGL
jgi:hypothetical protein